MLKKFAMSASGLALFAALSTGVALAQTASPSPSASPSPRASATTVPSSAPATGLGGGF